MGVLDEAFKPRAPTPQPFTPATPGGSYGETALNGEIANMLAVPIGAGRNHALNVAAFKIGRLIAGGHLNETHAIEALGAADGGLDHKQTRDTILSGITAGKNDPRHKTALTDPDQGLDAWLSSTPSPSSPPSATSSTPSAGTATPDTADGHAPTASSDSDLIRQHLPLIDWAELWANEHTEEWIVYPLLPARRLIAIYSAPKVGKSLLMLELAVAVAMGRGVLGETIDRPRRVLYVDFENDPLGDIRSRLKNMHVTPDDLTDLCYLSFPTMATLDTPQGATQLMAAVTEYACEVVVIDTVSRAVSGDENENDTWLSFYRETGLKMKQAGITMVRLDHSGKDDTKGQRGGSAKSGDVDAVWRMTRRTDDTFQLICEANRFLIPAGDKILTLTRVADPLRHRVDVYGARAAVVEAVIAHLDNIAAPLTGDGSGVPTLRPGIKAAGIEASRRNVEDAVKTRRQRAGIIDTDTDPEA